MAIAKAEITISRIIDIAGTTRYYLLQSSTTSTPSAPTVNPPGGSWVKTEPSYTTGSTNTLYFVDLTEFTNGTYKYSAVSKSSSYEAAKAAYNKAVNAQSTADGVKTDLSNNYTKKTLPDTRSDNQNPGWYITNYPQQIITEFKLTTVIGLTGETFCTLTTSVPWPNNSGGYPKQVAKVGAKEYWRVGTSDTAWGAWNDAMGKAEAAAKTATNYMKFESGKGLTIGDMTANTLGRNVLIDADSVDIRNGTKVLASYSDNAIQLGMNSPLSIIDLCSGTGSITSSALSDTDDWWKLDIHSQNSIGLNTGAGELTANNYYERDTSNWAKTTIRATATTPWTMSPDTYGIQPEYNGVIYLSAASKDVEAWGENHHYIDMTGPTGIVIAQESTPNSGDSRYAKIIVKSSQAGLAEETAHITLDAPETNVTGGLIFATNNERIWGVTTSGAKVEVFQAKNSSNNTVIGWGNYDGQAGNTNLYGDGILIRSATKDISIRADGGNAILRSDKTDAYAKVYGHEVYVQVVNAGTNFRPYFHGVDSFTTTFRGAGYVTSSGKSVYFAIPCAKPIIGSPTVSVTTVNGFILRQNNSYTHGSAYATTGYTYAKPTSYSASVDISKNFVLITATFSVNTNATNNSPIGIDWSGKITFAYG